MRCPIEKARVFPLPTLALDESKISQVVEILREYSKFLGLTDNMVSEKTIMVKGDWLTVRNVRIAMYQCTGEVTELDTFKWLEPIAGLFYLQMTVLKTFLQILWGKSRDASSLSRCHDALRRPKVSKDMKNFHACDDFFKTVIDVNVVAICITSARCKDISIYKKWLVNSDWPEEIFRLENLNLKPFEVQKLRSQATQKVNKITAITLAAK